MNDKNLKRFENAMTLILSILLIISFNNGISHLVVLVKEQEVVEEVLFI